MSSLSRKEAIREFKERVTPQGIFAIRCLQTPQCWVGASRNLDAQQNGIWFQLNTGSYRHAELQAAWKQFGAEAFTFETLEELPQDVSPIVIADVLKERRSHWAQQLNGIELR